MAIRSVQNAPNSGSESQWMPNNGIKLKSEAYPLQSIVLPSQTQQSNATFAYPSVAVNPHSSSQLPMQPYAHSHTTGAQPPPQQYYIVVTNKSGYVQPQPYYDQHCKNTVNQSQPYLNTSTHTHSQSIQTQTQTQTQTQHYCTVLRQLFQTYPQMHDWCQKFVSSDLITIQRLFSDNAAAKDFLDWMPQSFPDRKHHVDSILQSMEYQSTMPMPASMVKSEPNASQTPFHPLTSLPLPPLEPDCNHTTIATIPTQSQPQLPNPTPTVNRDTTNTSTSLSTPTSTSTTRATHVNAATDDANRDDNGNADANRSNTSRRSRGNRRTKSGAQNKPQNTQATIYECPECRKEYKTNQGLKEHISVVHRKERNFGCRFCDKSFGRRSCLLKHERSHTGERPYSCHVCSKRFVQSSDLTNHVRIHTGERPFECHLCPRKFAQKSNLRNHLKTHLKNNSQPR